MPKISVVVPCFNLVPCIRDCLDSVLSQSFADWECIVVDDESTDGSSAILDEYAAKDSRFKVIHQKNAGEGGARNAGLAVAQGEWVFFLDGDDIMAPGASERLAKIIDRHPNEDLIRFGFENFEDGEDLTGVENRCVGKRSGVDRVVDISRQISYDDYFVYVWQFVFRRTMIAGMKFDRYKRGADRTFIIPVLCYKANSFVATDDVCYLYRKRLGSAVNSRASVQVLKDELSHRVDVIETIDRSVKVMPYRRTDWLEGYCIRSYQQLVLADDSYSPGERKDLMAWFYHELPRLRIAKDYSRRAKLVLGLYRIFRGETSWHFISYILPVAVVRMKILLTDPARVVKRLRG